MKYFTFRELTHSNTADAKGIDNTPSSAIKVALKMLVDNVLDPLREAWGAPIIVTSGYRSPRLNQVVGGAKSSQHMKGEAADIRTLSDKPEDNKRLFLLIIKLGLPFDQLIDERNYNWIHVSYGPLNRRQVLHL